MILQRETKLKSEYTKIKLLSYTPFLNSILCILLIVMSTRLTVDLISMNILSDRPLGTDLFVSTLAGSFVVIFTCISIVLSVEYLIYSYIKYRKDVYKGMV